MKANQVKRTVKVSFMGEMKRLKLTQSYNELVSSAKKAFGMEHKLPEPIKFFYLDEENEVISITSQSDYTEAFEFETGGALKLIIAGNAVDARLQLLKNIEDSRPLAESLNQSQIMSQIGSMRQSRADKGEEFMFSDFDKVSHAEFVDASPMMMESIRRSTLNTINPQSKQVHEIACGGDEVFKSPVDIGTDVSNLVQRATTGINTARVQTKDQIIDTKVDTKSSGVQAQRKTRDMGCDGVKTDMVTTASQMDVQMSDTEVNCQLLIPDEKDKEEAIEQEVPCFKCEGSSTNKKGLPCRKCKGTGMIMSNELSELQEYVKAEVGEYVKESFTQMIKEFIMNKREEQDNQVHEGFECDGCGVCPIKGIRYKCAIQTDYDICEKCEKAGVNKQHPMIKIRKPCMAPYKVICQMGRNDVPTQPVARPQPKPQRQATQVRYSGRFVRESMQDKTDIEAGHAFSKTWTFRNDGDSVWPSGTKLIQSSGDNLQSQEVATLKEVLPGQEIEFTVDMIAPMNEGKYTAFFRLQIGSIKFGQKCWCDIMVVKPKPVVAQPVAMVSQETTVKPQPKVIAAAEPVYKEEEKDEKMCDKDEVNESMMSSHISLNKSVSPKEAYAQKAQEQESAMKEALMNLYDFGFTDFSLNKALMNKYKDANTVAERLCVGVPEKEAKELVADDELYD